MFSNYSTSFKVAIINQIPITASFGNSYNESLPKTQ
jgi:hypothetical protein